MVVAPAELVQVALTPPARDLLVVAANPGLEVPREDPSMVFVCRSPITYSPDVWRT
jgi:hypothetical protein